jgi:formate hydrogenlyase transcriptional activator
MESGMSSDTILRYLANEYPKTAPPLASAFPAGGVYPESQKAGKSERSFLSTIVARSNAFRSLFSQVEVVAPTDATILITGETGTGKEVIARVIHELSPRRSRALVKMNCAAMPAGLFESELFGHERGAFTGAINSHPGRFAIAHQGTLLLDEIGDMALELQPKLLRVLQEREFEAVGSTRTRRVDVRVIAATNHNLRDMVAERSFREDLYYRLNMFPLVLPPLRERKADIPVLAMHFLKEFASAMRRHVRTIPSDTMRALLRYEWPGNVRELQNYVARGVILSAGETFDAPPPHVAEPPAAERHDHPTLEDKIREEILAECRRANWRLGGPRGAAARLGLKRTTLFYKMKRLGISPPATPSED